jgi:hypothetical protein
MPALRGARRECGHLYLLSERGLTLAASSPGLEPSARLQELAVTDIAYDLSAGSRVPSAWARRWKSLSRSMKRTLVVSESGSISFENGT